MAHLPLSFRFVYACEHRLALAVFHCTCDFLKRKMFKLKCGVTRE